MKVPVASRKWTRRVEALLMILCGIFLAGGFVVEKLSDPVPSGGQVLYLLAYLTGGYFGVIAGFGSLRRGVVDVDLLMVLAALGAAYVGAPFEGGMLLFLFALSNVLQSHALDKSRKAIQSLMTLRPDEVQVQEQGRWVTRAVESVEPGSVVRVRPGESIALDGAISRGESEINEASLTGESMPVSKKPGDPVFAGTLNQSGLIEIRVGKRSSESTLSRIVELVERAQSEKAGAQRFLEKAERRYALGVILFTLLLIFLPGPLLGEDFDTSFYRAMTVMVVASPCALIISTPAAYLSAIGGGARQGILFKGGVHLERLAKVDVVAFDKTGTLTRGRPQVTDILPLNGVPPDELLRIAAALEAHSDHPLARSITRRANGRGLDIPEVERLDLLSGKGLRGVVRGQTHLVGSPALFRELGCEMPPEVEELRLRGRTVVLVGKEADAEAAPRLCGALGLADQLRSDTAATVLALKKLGIRRVVMLTGDHASVAKNIAEEAGMDEVFAELLPEDKLRVVRELAEHGTVAMVGDGVNDAPALAAAHVGIAMGAAGTDVALETADVVLMSEQLSRLPTAFRLGRKTRRIVTQNLVFAMGVIVVLVFFALTRGIPLPLGVVGHEGSTVLVCLNGLRLLRRL